MSSFFPGYFPMINARTVVYYEQGEHGLFNRLLDQNYEKYSGYCREQGFDFIYPGGLGNLSSDSLERMANQLRYLYPHYFHAEQKGISRLVEMLFERYPGEQIYIRFADLLGNMNYPQAGFVIFDEDVDLVEKADCRILELDHVEREALASPDPEGFLHKRLMNFFINELGYTRKYRTNVKRLIAEDRTPEPVFTEYSLNFEETAPDPERMFAEEADRVSRELGLQFTRMLKNGEEALLLDLLTEFLEQLKTVNPEMIPELERLFKVKFNEGKQPLSTLHLVAIRGGYDFRIVLPDYDLEIEMTPLCKTLYLFFLRHPEGVILKNMADHRDELLHIYTFLSNLSDKEQIRDNIDRLVDVVMDNSIHVNCARIKSAFLEKINDQLAMNYYIGGKRGKPKKIALRAGLVSIDPLILM
jgi:hypothetical protein